MRASPGEGHDEVGPSIKANGAPPARFGSGAREERRPLAPRTHRIDPGPQRFAGRPAKAASGNNRRSLQNHRRKFQAFPAPTRGVSSVVERNCQCRIRGNPQL